MNDNFSIRAKAYLLGASFGASALVVQTEFLRAVMEAAAGGALAVSAALGAWLFWIALGAAAGGLLVRVVESPGKTAFFCALLSLPLGLGLIFLAGIPRRWLGVGPGELIPFETLLTWNAMVCAGSALLVGLSFPVLARLASEGFLFERENTAAAVGGLWAAEAAGALVAGVLFTFILAGRTTPVMNICLFSSVPPVVAGLSGIYHTRPGRIFSAALVPAVLLALIFSPRLESRFLGLRWEAMGSQGQVRAAQWTHYRSLVLAELDNQATVYDNGVPAFSFPDPYNDASFLCILLGQVRRPERILVVGPAAYGPAQAFLSAGAAEVVAVHPDRALEQMITSNLPQEMREVLESGGYRYVGGDGRVYLARWGRRPPVSAGSPAETGAGSGSGLIDSASGDGSQHRLKRRAAAGWDLVLLNLDGPAQINSARYYTPEFFRRCRRAFSPAGGVLALRLPMGANEPYPAQLDQAASIWASLKTSFQFLGLAVTQTHCHIFAADRPGLLSGDLDTLTARVAPYEKKVAGFTRYLLPMYYDPTRTGPLCSMLESRSRQLASNTDTAPVAWLHHLRLWVRLARQQKLASKPGPGPLEVLFDYAAALKNRGFVALPALVAGLLLVFSWVLAQRTGRPAAAARFAVILSVAAAGFVSMGATVLLIYLCQLVFGALFYQVALITAVFMAALALGAWRSAGAAVADMRGGRVYGALALSLSAGSLLPAGAVYFLDPLQGVSTLGAAGAIVAFYLMVAAAGYFCGAMFPWAAALHAAALERPLAAGTASTLDFADHLGACLGAVAFGVVAVPVLGIGPAALSLALTMACPALFWLAAAAGHGAGRPGER
ncbi:MAG: hypothetical protein JXQ83_11535 [Candidatus Glassbacteria bacterium]|nr:hypothetical protein [Candidatus Glassbacteria bacterium]